MRGSFPARIVFGEGEARQFATGSALFFGLPPFRAQLEGWILGVPGLIRRGKGRDDSYASAACDLSLFRLHLTTWPRLQNLPRFPTPLASKQ